MAKNGNTFYLQLSRRIFTDEYSNLSDGAFRLYVWLNELEQRYTGESRDFFFRTNEELAKDVGMSDKTLKKYKKELIESGLIEHWLGHFIMPDGKKSEKKVSCYRIL
ncbi:MAG: helix-turn-helix domain-containing protein [Clostridiales bacterium]|nr:helix-turn-helix domain-containing protein [Clostridiales bacterium]